LQQFSPKVETEDNKMKLSKFSTQLSAWLFVLCSVISANPLLPLNAKACASDEMTSEEAAKLLKGHEMFAATQTVTLNTGMIYAKVSDVERYQPKYAAFKSMGLIELTSVKTDAPDKDPGNGTERTRVSLTEKGLQESKSWKQVRENEWSITAATRELIKVIEVHKNSEGRIHGIEFSWAWAPTKTGESLKFSYSTERAYAKLKLQDAGWQIVSIHALDPLQSPRKTAR
jgi:hypothetical protein